MKKLLVVFALLCVVSTSVPAASPIGYTITDLGEMFNSGTTFGAKDINELGQVALNLDGTAYIWDNGSLSPVEGLLNNNTSFAINNDGDLAWTYNLRAQYYNGASQTQLPTLESNGLTSGWDINIHDHIVGTSRVGSINATRGYLWDGLTMTDLGSLPGEPTGDSRGLGINDAGVIVGAGGDSPVPVRWVGGVIDELALASLDGFDNGSAEDINEAGQIAGTLLNSSLSGGMAAKWEADGTLEQLGRLAGHGFSRAEAINELGDVVGWSTPVTNGGSGFQAAFFSDGAVYNLNDFISEPGWNLTKAYGINTTGQIVGAGVLSGENHAFLLSPIPEPGRVLLLMVGAFAVAARRRR
jgi:uncharacterized membrane protein